VLLGQQPTASADAALAVQVANAIAGAAFSGALPVATLRAAAAAGLAAHGVRACGG